MFSSCEKCGQRAKSGEDLCPKCQRGDNDTAPSDDKFNRICECGKRGRIIKKNEQEMTRCYDCYHSRDKVLEWLLKCSQSERAYYFATVELYLKPLFYGEEPNHAALQLAHDKMLGITL